MSDPKPAIIEQIIDKFPAWAKPEAEAIAAALARIAQSNGDFLIDMALGRSGESKWNAELLKLMTTDELLALKEAELQSLRQHRQAREAARLAGENIMRTIWRMAMGVFFGGFGAIGTLA